MKAIKYFSVFALGAVVAAIAMSQVQQSPAGVPGTNRPWEDSIGRAYGTPVMQLDGYGGTNTGLTGNWNTAAIGPVLEIRKHLTDLQQQSLAANRRDPKQRVLVRFEITEAWIDTMHSTDSIEIPVRTVLYWAKSRPGKYERFGEIRHVIEKLKEGEAHYKAGASLAEVELETRDIFVTSPATGDHVYGTDGWKIACEKTKSRDVKKVGQYNDAVAFYDTSLTTPAR
jgi:hypothetical protein